MYKLVSNIKGSKWSFLDGYNVFNTQTVWLLDKKDMWKYYLLDKDGNKINISVEKLLVEE